MPVNFDRDTDREALSQDARICVDYVMVVERRAQSSANCRSASTSLLLAVLMLRSPLFSWLDETIFTQVSIVHDDLKLCLRRCLFDTLCIVCSC